MSALTSSIALSWSGRLRVGEGLLELGLPGRVGREGVAGLGLAPAVELDQLLGDLPHRGAHAGLLAGPLRSAHPVERRRLAPCVGRDGVDLLGRQVEPVAAPVLELEVVALGAADRARHHAGEAGDAVHVVDDVVTRSEVVEETFGGTRPRPRLAVRPPPAGHVRLGDDGELRAGDEGAPVERRDDDVTPPGGGARRRRPPAARRGGGRRRKPFAVEHRRHPLGAPAAVGADHHPVAGAGELAEAPGEPGGVAQHRRPARGLQARRSGSLSATGSSDATLAPSCAAGGGRTRGAASASPPRCRLLEGAQVVARLSASATSSSSSSVARSRSRRGSTSTTRACSSEQIGEEVFLAAQPRQPGLHAVEQLPVRDPGEVVPGEGCLGRERAGRARARPR